MHDNVEDIYLPDYNLILLVYELLQSSSDDRIL